MKRISRQTMAENWGISERTVDRRLTEIESLIGVRYPARSITRAPVRVRSDVAEDFMEHRKQIQAGTAPAFIGR